MRLQRFLARSGVASRRKSELLIAEGRVKVNGRIVTELGTKVDPCTDIVEFDGRRIIPPKEERPTVIMLNKPKGYITSMENRQGTDDRLVSDIVPIEEVPGLFYVGRLDRDTTGLLLFTNDGDLGNALTHPSRGVCKRYVAHIEGRLSEDDAASLERGIMLDDGITSPARCEILDTFADDSQSVSLVIHEGRKRQVRRMFSALGHEVRELERTDFGPLGLGSLQEGEWRRLDETEMSELYRSCGLQYVYN